MPTVTVYPIRDARIYEPNLGAGRSPYLPIGLASGSIYRTLIKFRMPDWSGLKISRITDVTFKARQTSQNYVARGSTPRFYIQRLIEDFSDSGSATSMTTSNAVTWSNQPQSTLTGRSDTGTLANSNEDTFLVSNAELIAMARRWAPTSVEGGSGETHYGVKLVSYDEGSTTRTTEIYAIDADVYDPRLVFAYETNTAPGAPVSRSPVQDSEGNPTIVAKASGYVNFSFTRVDPDAGDTISKWDIEIYPDSVTDSTPPSTGNRLISASSGAFNIYDVATSKVVGVNVASLTPGTPYRWRVRTYDREQAAGAWSSLNDARFTPNTIPGAPTSPSVDVSTLTPNFYGTLDDADAGATISGAQVQVYQDTGGGSIAKWNDDVNEDGDPYVSIAGGTRATIPYGGSSALEYGVKYRYRLRLRDNVGSFGSWTNWIEWTPLAITGPTALAPISIETKVNTLTPTFTIGHGVAFDQYEFEIYRYNDLASTRHYFSGTVSGFGSLTTRNHTLGAPLPDWGRTYWWRARVRPTGGGAISTMPWSQLYPFYINALPRAPILELA